MHCYLLYSEHYIYKLSTCVNSQYIIICVPLYSGRYGHKFLDLNGDLYLITCPLSRNANSIIFRLQQETGEFYKMYSLTVGRNGHHRITPFWRGNDLYFLVANRYHPTAGVWSETSWEYLNSTSYVMKWV